MVFQVVGHDGLCASIRSGLQYHFTRWAKQLRPPLAVGADWRSNAPQGPSSSFSASFNVRWPEKINRCPNPPEPESKPAKAASWSAVRFTALLRIRQVPGSCFVLRAGPELRLNRFTAMAAHGKLISGIEPASSALCLRAARANTDPRQKRRKIGAQHVKRLAQPMVVGHHIQPRIGALRKGNAVLHRYHIISPAVGDFNDYALANCAIFRSKVSTPSVDLS